MSIKHVIKNPLTIFCLKLAYDASSCILLVLGSLGIEMEHIFTSHHIPSSKVKVIWFYNKGDNK